MTAIETFCASRKFTAQQAASLVQVATEISPFEAVEVAVLLHDRMLNPDSYQLVMDVFETDADRENIAHRLRAKRDVRTRQQSAGERAKS